MANVTASKMESIQTAKPQNATVQISKNAEQWEFAKTVNAIARMVGRIQNVQTAIRTMIAKMVLIVLLKNVTASLVEYIQNV